MAKRSILSGSTPDITPAQIAAAVGWVVAQLVAWGYIDQAQAQLAVSLGATVLAAAWKIADAWLRGRRAHALASNPSPPADQVAH